MTAKTSALALLTGLAFTLSASADEVRGRIVGVDLPRHTLRVEGRGPYRGRTLTLTLTPDTSVQFGRQAGEPTDLRAGRRARIVYDEHDGKKVVRSIRVVGPRPARVARPAAPASGDLVTGILRRVAFTEREVVVVGPKGEVTVAVPDKVRVTRDGKPITFDDLEEGERVAVQVERHDGRRTALAIRVGAGAAEASPAAAMRPNLIQRIRLGLRIADQILERVDRACHTPPEREP